MKLTYTGFCRQLFEENYQIEKVEKQILINKSCTFSGKLLLWKDFKKTQTQQVLHCQSLWAQLQTPTRYTLIKCHSHSLPVFSVKLFRIDIAVIWVFLFFFLPCLVKHTWCFASFSWLHVPSQPVLTHCLYLAIYFEDNCCQCSMRWLNVPRQLSCCEFVVCLG